MPTFMTTPGDVMTLVRTARQIDANPFSLAGKLVGLGAEEQQAGVPAWAWLIAGLGVGALVGYRLAPAARARVRAFT